MNYSIYLTDSCNLNCKYCYEKNMHANTEIKLEVVQKLIDREIKNKTKQCILTFFGGEPLLKKELIYEIAEYIDSKKSKTQFLYNITTNGTLIDDKFIRFVQTHSFIAFSISIDGLEEVQNQNRVYQNQSATYSFVESNTKKLLEKTDIPIAVPVVTKNNEQFLLDNVENLLKLGFHKINFQFDLTAKWKDEDLIILRKGFEQIADLYMMKMREEKEFDILAIDEKINSYIDEKINVNDNCSVGLRGANVGTNGKIYPCMQFMYDDRYEIGDCNTGIDKEKQRKVNLELKQELEECKECSYRKRCNHTCSCINNAFSGKANETAPFTCEIERMMIEIADDIAEKMYAEKNSVFMQKFYNGAYRNIENKINILNKGKK